jgi:hypothetical protein
MSTSRRDFLKFAALLSGATGISGFVPESIQRALAIEPEPGSTFADAEHIVILMQENRSVDHALGIILRSIFTLRRLPLRLRVTRRLRRRMHGRIGIPLLLLPSRLHSERRRIGLPWAGYRYRQDFHTFSRQP